jgi:phage terminase small subunit
MKERPQNERRTRFISEYLQCLNASEAARRAGYKMKANVAGPRLLAKDSIKTEISRRISEAMGAEKDGLKRRIVDELEKEAFAESKFTDETKGGTITRSNPNKLKALELLAKYAKLLEDVPANTNVFINYPSEFKE